MDEARFHPGYIRSIGVNIHYDSKIASIADKEVTVVYKNLQEISLSFQ